MEDTFVNHLEIYINKEDLDKIRKCDDIYLKSISLVKILFSDKKDKSGEAYLGHIFRVSNRMTTIDGKVLGLLHDVVEDILYVDFNDLLDIGIPNHIIDALKLVTKEPVTKMLSKQEKLINYNMEIDKIITSGNNLALELKIADMSDNYDPERLKKLPPEKVDWFKEKYANNLVKLKDAKEKRMIKC